MSPPVTPGGRFGAHPTSREGDERWPARLPDGAHGRVIHVAILTVLAALMRAAVLLSTIDVPGDGPVRALLAYNWAKAPHLVLHGVWLPGFLYLTGLVSYVLPMWMALRLFNAVVGAATIPVFFATLVGPFGPTTGIIAAALLAGFPLHVELSATSLSEVSAVFELLIGMAFLRRAAHLEGRARRTHLALAIGSLALASMTRYELWFLLPLFPGYYWLRTRQGLVTLTMAALLLAFPVAWTLGNHVYEGQAFLGLTAAVHDRSFADARIGTSVTRAGAIVITRFAAHLGWALVVGFLIGLAMEVRALAIRRLSLERSLYLAIVLVSVAGVGAFTVLRGETVGDRNILFTFILAIPIAVVPAAPYLSRLGRRARWVVVAGALIYSLGLPGLTGHPETRWVTSATPHAIIGFGQWLSQSPWRDQPVVFTRMDWQPTYFPYYFPGHASKTLIVSEWIDDARLRELALLTPPALLVTRRGDEAYVQRFVTLTGMAVEHGRPVHRLGDLEVYELGHRAGE